MSAHPLSFSTLTLIGQDSEKFLQGQVTVDVTHISADEYRPTAICDLKGRIAFGLWLTRKSHEQIDIVIATDLLDSFKAHIRKYGAFSKMVASDATSIYPAVVNGQAVFQATETTTIAEWQTTAIATGAAWITAATVGLFQPQELRLHQRQGVNYDKGCYLGQEIVARLYFRAKPKAWLHRVEGSGVVPQAGQSISPNITAVNVVATANEGWEALVVAKPEALNEAGLVILDLPHELSGEVGRAS